ncbi:IGF-like family receptor 1, partial [Trematomus bernacchii]|uniref:IGF-like family receptor 1 n=1 Tax=Trematomus bernacchii TaxID=40690 RepID=UPI00146EDA02
SSSGPNVLSAPLQTVLDNLDVLEELVILLDPESHGVKTTKHLASHCSFPATWITYTYSMKESKSPLKAVFEGVTSRHPD